MDKKSVMMTICAAYLKVMGALQTFLAPVLLLVMRVWMARVFWYSGLTKISSWQSTLFLFREEYKVPLIPYELAAYMGTGFELLCPVLLVLGIFSRLATLPLIGMTAVIQFTYLNVELHLYWALLLGTILVYGPGIISVDHWFKKKMEKRLV